MTDLNESSKALSSTESSPQKPETRVTRSHRFMARFLINRFRVVLDKIHDGQLEIVWPDGYRTVHGPGGEKSILTLLNYQPIKQLLLNGSNGFSESYILGDWEVDDIDAFFMLIMRNEAALFEHFAGGWLGRVKNSLGHALKRNSKSGSKKNIQFHYDLGNDFYREWLDESMVYSSAMFESPEQSLLEAQKHKLSQIVELLDLKSEHKVLEIGCGWGALSQKMARISNCQVDAISLSQEQLSYAREEHSVKGRIEYLFKDYRDIQGQYDRIVSIEMFEAVGQRYWEQYFERLNSLLKTDGTAVLQTITIEEERFEEYSSNPDFIQRYIFPGGMLPTRTHLVNLIKNAGFDLVEETWFGADYATTLSRWRDTFESKLSTVKALGYDDNFIRLWRYYFAYCETGFNLGSTDVGLLKIARQ